MWPECSREELVAGLDRVVERIFEKAGVEGPPVDAFAVARALDIAVAVDNRQEGRARYVRLGGHHSHRCRASILLRPDPRRERRQWAVAHEIGEHVACHVFAEWGVDPVEIDPSARENVANNVAGRLLLPTIWFADDGASCRWNLVALKRIYATASHELIARRMLECRPPVIISIFDQRKISFRRSNLPGRIPLPSVVEMACWQDTHEQGRFQQFQEGPCLIQGWPIHENEWKREIVRVEVDDAALSW